MIGKNPRTAGALLSLAECREQKPLTSCCPATLVPLLLALVPLVVSHTLFDFPHRLVYELHRSYSMAAFV